MVWEGSDSDSAFQKLAKERRQNGLKRGGKRCCAIFLSFKFLITHTGVSFMNYDLPPFFLVRIMCFLGPHGTRANLSHSY